MDHYCCAKHSDAIHKRVGHIAVNYKHYIVVWGGFVGEKVRMGSSEYCPTDQIWIYNCLTEVWSFELTKGRIPFKNSGSTGLVLDNCLYVFGGIEELTDEIWRYSNDLYRLNLITKVWDKLNPSGIVPLGCDKGDGWVYNGKLYFFGGYGQKPTKGCSLYEFVVDYGSREESRGWNNQMWSYEPQRNAWVWPKTRGVPPQPRAAHAVALSGNKAYVFGGRLGELRNNDLYCLNLDSMTWSPNLTISVDGEVPEGRSWHSFSFVDNDRAIVYGGLNQMGVPSLSWWELRVDALVWRQHMIKYPLVWHKATPSSATGELIIVGGVSQSPYYMNNEDHVHQLLVLQFQPPSLFRLCLKLIVEGMKRTDLTAQSAALPLLLTELISARLP